MEKRVCRTYNCQSKRKKKTIFVPRCGKMGHKRRYCQVNTWCKFCITDTHATQTCRKYEKFVKNNPITSSRRNTPVQVQGQRSAVNPQERPQQPLFPHPPVQCYNLTVIPQIAMHNWTPQEEKRESREHSQKITTKPDEGDTDLNVKTTSLPKEVVRTFIWIVHYQKPPQYAEINYHRALSTDPSRSQ